MKKTKYIILLLILILTTSCTEENLKDDYYDYINKDIMKENSIKDNETGWSVFSKIQDEVDNKVSNIITNITSSPKNNKEIKISNFNKLITDTNTRNNYNIKPLQKYINLVDNSSNIKEFITNSITIENELSIDIFTKATVTKDFKDNTKNIIYFYPINFDYNLTSDYYINSDYLYYHALLKQSNIKLLKQYGYTKEQARTSAKLVDEFYTNIAKMSKTNKDLNNIENYYNIITKQELQQIYTNIDIDYYLKQSNINKTNTFSIVDKNNYIAINNYLTDKNLYTLKEYVKLKILQNYAIYSSENYANIIYELNYKLQGLEKDNLTQEEKNKLIIQTYFNYDIDKLYTEKYFTKEKQEYITNMIKDILNHYKKRLNQNKWLSTKTKEKAITKLNNITINVGIPNKYPVYSDNYIIDNNISLVENIININKTLSNYTMSKLDNTQTETSLPQTTVNAYYNPQDNSINFPSSLSTIINIDDNYYKNLGSIGMIIAHEITHAFDPNGAMFDECGNLSNWWTKEDYQKFNNLKEKVIDYYNKYEVLDGIYIDGSMTANENIADLGGISCIVSLAESKKASKEEFKILFSSFANIWASNYKEDYQKLLLLQDNHSPNKYRVNATLSTVNTFYKVYNINIFDNMYISPKDRIEIW